MIIRALLSLLLLFVAIVPSMAWALCVCDAPDLVHDCCDEPCESEHGNGAHGSAEPLCVHWLVSSQGSPEFVVSGRSGTELRSTGLVLAFADLYDLLPGPGKRKHSLLEDFFSGNYVCKYSLMPRAPPVA